MVDAPLLLQDVEHAFDDLMAGERTALLKLANKTPIGGQTGVEIYARTAMTALIGALEDTFMTCHHIVGEDYFRQCAVAFCRHSPMDTSDLNLFGADFPAFIVDLVERQEELASLAFLGDLCHLEWALNAAFFARQTEPFDLEGFQALSFEQREALCFQLAADVHLLHSPFNVKELYLFHQDDANLVNERTFNLQEGDFYFLVRKQLHEDGHDILIEEIDAAMFALLTAIAEQMSFAELCQTFAKTVDGDLQPPDFGHLIAKGIIEGYE